MSQNPELSEELPDDERYRQQVISSFFRNGRLTSIPSQLKKREIVYRRMLEGIVIGDSVTEKELNARIEHWHEDYCTIRRDMISLGLMTRSPAKTGDIYTRIG